MRDSKAFVLGAIMGAAVWLWGRDIEEYVEDKTRGVRTKAAEGVGAVEEKAGKVLDRGRDTLRFGPMKPVGLVALSAATADGRRK